MTLRPGIAHGARLEILGYLMWEPLTLAQIGERTGRGAADVAYHVAVLESLRLVDAVAVRNGEPRYTARLEAHPAWMIKAVNDHRIADPG